jgi:hypothetical protein
MRADPLATGLALIRWASAHNAARRYTRAGNDFRLGCAILDAAGRHDLGASRAAVGSDSHGHGRRFLPETPAGAPPEVPAAFSGEA